MIKVIQTFFEDKPLVIELELPSLPDQDNWTATRRMCDWIGIKMAGAVFAYREHYSIKNRLKRLMSRILASSKEKG